jgi:hypothetical protein
MAARNTFVDPMTGATYAWHRNHLEEDANETTRRITTVTLTAAPWKTVRSIRMQGKRATCVKRYTGRISHPDQHAAFLLFWRISQERTVRFTHTEGDEYEVVVTKYEPTRIGVAESPNRLRHIWTYTLEMIVVEES